MIFHVVQRVRMWAQVSFVLSQYTFDRKTGMDRRA